MIILSPKKLRSYRKRRKKKQAELAKLFDVERTTYVGYEQKDTLEVTPEVAEAVAKYLEVEVTALESRENVENDGDPLSDGRYRIFEGDYIGLHKMAWGEFQQTLKHERETLTHITQNNTTLTASNAKLSEGITELVKLLRPNEQR